ncbi:putative mucin TcMUCII [Trypanosoma cruzi]|nr:putative mucin TcMUCII [Trypanosoma cruzi]
MMMTCRLLCALLVLALCCCPSVCASEIAIEGETDGDRASPSLTQPKPITTKPESSVLTTMTTAAQDVQKNLGGPEGNKNATSKPSLPLEGGHGNSRSVSPGLGSVAEPVKFDRDETRLPALEPQPHDAKNTVQAEGTKEQQSGTEPSAEQTNKVSETSAQTTTTTTTTTKAPTTTTTTAPEAPSTTTTEAPTTTTTTRAPPRLREIDGSLSGSAWVCAPLVLAASALAYTAVG